MQQSKRILFLDVMRALAVILMLQGHTISALGDFSEIDKSSSYYQIWSFIRGITAPLFIFTAGTVFIYLLDIGNKHFFSNVRVRKGLVRFITLLIIGYLLNYPTLRIFDFSDVTTLQWLQFFSVDALHLIAFGILSLILIRYISHLTGLNEFVTYMSAALLVLMITPYVLNNDWTNITILPLASYFTYNTGSFFPLFPWLFYIFAGGGFGSILRKNETFTQKPGFYLTIIGAGIILFIIPIILDYSFYNELASVDYLRTDVLLSIKRLGIVLLIAGLLSLLFARSARTPKVILSIGRNSLLIYILHLILIYGCVLIPGLTFIWKNSFSITISALIAITITIIFSILSILIDRKKLNFDNSRDKNLL